MAKKKSRNGCIVFILILISLFTLAIFNQPASIVLESTLTDEDFSISSPATSTQPSSICVRDVNQNDIGTITCEDDNWISIGYTGDFKFGASEVQVTNGELILSASGSTQPASATFKKNLKGRNIEIPNIKWQYGYNCCPSGSATIRIFFNNKLAYDENIEQKSGSKDILFQAIADDENIDLYHIFINGKDTGRTVLIEEDTLNIKLETLANGEASSSTMRIDSIESQPIFSCTISDDEIVFTEKLYSGSKISLDSEKHNSEVRGLTHKPLKFCPEGNPVLRRDLDLGIRPEFFSTTFNKLIAGEIVEVPEDELMEIRYVIDFKEGLPDSNCAGESYELNGECIQAVTEQPDVVELVNVKEFIPVGSNQLLFQDSMKIADKQLTSGKPSYLCANEDSKATAPLPRPECWTTTVNYGQSSLIFIDREIKNINQFMTLKILIDARYKEGAVEEGYANNFLLSINNDDILQVNTITGNGLEDFYVLFNKEKNIEFEVTNNLGKFDQSGVIVRKITTLLTGESKETINLGFDKGTRRYTIPIDSSKFGGLTYEIVFWYKIGDQTFFDNEKIIRSFEVVDKSPFQELQEKLQEIDELEGTIAEKAELIKQLTSKREEQFALIKELELTLSEEAQYLIELKASIDEQASYINSLEINLQKKAELVSKLNVENDMQAELIKAMELSFSEQGAIISELKKTVKDDAQIIAKITNENDEQVEIVASLQRTNEEKGLIIKELSQSLEEEKELKNKLNQLEDTKEEISFFSKILQRIIQFFRDLFGG